MRLQTIVTVFALTLPSLASVLNLNIYTDSATGKKSVGKAKATEDQKAIVIVEDSKPPRWRRRDSNHLIPLVPGAKTGALPIAYEEGLTSACKYSYIMFCGHLTIADSNHRYSGTSFRQCLHRSCCRSSKWQQY